MDKRDEEIAQLKKIVHELTAARSESAATSAVLEIEGRRHFPVGGIFRRLISRFWGFKILLLVLLLVALLLGGWYVFSGSTLKKESVTFVEHVQDLSTLATAEAHIKVIMEQEDHKLFGKDISMNLPGTKRELLLVIPATVIAGVDLQGVTADDIKVNEKTKELEIILPKASLLQDPAINMEEVRTFSDEGLFRGEVTWEEGFDLAAEAQQKIIDEAMDMGILHSAEKSAETVLKEFFSHLGYTVTLTFK